MDSIWRPVLKTWYFRKWKDYRRMTLHRLISDIEILSPFVMGIPDVIGYYPDCKGFFGSAFGSVRSRNGLVCMCVWRYNLRCKAGFYQIHFCWWRRIYSLSLTPFSEMYELRGYVVEGYQRYTSNLVVWHAKCCCVLMIIGWSFVIKAWL